MYRLVLIFVFAGWMVLASKPALPALAADTDKFSVILKKVDELVCTNP